MDASKLIIETWPTDRPQPYDKNARIIPQSAIDAVAKSITAFGWQQPLVVDKDDILVVGHTRLLAAKQLGLKEVPVHVVKNLTEQQVRAYRLMDNRANQDTMWDTLVLRDELSRLGEIDGLDISLTGFTDTEFNAFANKVDIGRFQDPPKTFKEFDAGIDVDVKCPHCGYEWKKGQGTKTVEGDPDVSE